MILEVVHLGYKKALRVSGLFKWDKRRQCWSDSAVSAGLKTWFRPEASRVPSNPNFPNCDCSFPMQFVKR